MHGVDHDIARTARANARATLARPLIVGVAYYAAAVMALALAQNANGYATMWPAGGILLAALLLAKPKIAPYHMIAASAASVLANLQFGAGLWTAIGFTAANIAEPLIVLWLLHGRERKNPLFTSPRGLFRVSLAAMAASMASSMLAMVVVSTPSFVFFVSWFLSDLLGILIVTPLIFVGAEIVRAKEQARIGERAKNMVVWLGLLSGGTIATFAQTDFPLLFVPMLFLLIAVFRLGALGGTTGLVIIAVIGSIATDMARGPVAMIEGGRETQVVFLQLYLLALFASALPTAALLAMRDTLTARLAERNHLLTLAENTAHVGHWRYHKDDREIFWSTEVFRIHGISSEKTPGVADTIMAYHVDDRHIVQAAIDAALVRGQPFDFSARIVRPDGTICHVLSRGNAEFSAAGEVVGLFGMLQDISVHVAAEQALDQARAVAEQAARRATRLAETDQLTGIANRRKALDVLTASVANAFADNTALSVAIFDIDHFKNVNDTYGHSVGDAVLRRVAHDARHAAGVDRTIGRLGGEEFVIVMPNAGPDHAYIVAERVRIAIEQGGRAQSDEPQVSASFGIASLYVKRGSVGDACNDLLSRADHALYAAKDAGRNTLRQAA